ncbi:MAG: hypothetical protein OXS40_05920, partial [Gammaproteobacteria bacterium]|nr:hypothetical protein [Gammaproteobacteria bacterium]
MSFTIYIEYLNTHDPEIVMTGQPETTPAIELTPDEVERLPARLRKKIKARRKPRGKRGRWVLIGAAS